MGTRPDLRGGHIATLDDFRGALEARGHRVKKSGGSYVTTCPAHEDKEPSLSFSEGKQTELVATCHAGCTFEAILSALDLDETPRGDDWDARVERAYDYVDEDGELLYQAVRLRNPKSFRQRTRRTDGSWEWKLGDVRRVLYRLPEILAAQGRAVIVVEGEKDADALSALGLCATCSPMGAGKWRDEYVDSLRHVAAVVVVADCDGPGREHAKTICQSVHDAGIPTRLVDLALDRDDGYDVSDFLIEHGDAARAKLEQRIRETRRWPIAERARLPVQTWKDFSASIGDYDDSLDYLGAFLRGGQRVHAIGPIGHGKTTFMAEAVSAALYGRDFLGFQGRGGGIRGCYIDLEMPGELLKQTFDAARFDLASDVFDLVHLPDGLEVDRNEQHREMVESIMGEYAIVAIDPWYKLIADELSEGMRNVRTVLSFLDGMRKRHPRTAVMIGFHANEAKQGQRITGLGDASGYKAFQRPADTAVLFERVAGDRSRVTWAKTRSARLPKMGEKWAVEWTRGEGFRKVERRNATDELHELMLKLAPWQDAYQLGEAWGGKSRSRTAEVANQLVYEGRATSRTIGKRTQYLAVLDGQERMDVSELLSE